MPDLAPAYGVSGVIPMVNEPGRVRRLAAAGGSRA